MDTTEIQRILRHYNEKLYSNKLYNIEEMGKFLETYNLPRLNHEEIENMNRPRVSKDISQQRKTQDQMASVVSFTKHNNNNKNNNAYKSFPKKYSPQFFLL